MAEKVCYLSSKQLTLHVNQVSAGICASITMDRLTKLPVC